MKAFDCLTVRYGDIKDETFDFAILPWGATEPHNYHLPYLTDCYISHDVSIHALKKANVKTGIKGMILPPVPFGSQNPGQHGLAFCIHARYETQKAILTDIVASLSRQNIKKLIIVNGHGGNSFKQMIRDLAVDYLDFLIVSAGIGHTTFPETDIFDELGDHAGEVETSLMLYYRPELVNIDIAGTGETKNFRLQSLKEGMGWIPRDWMKVSKDTGVGNPFKSTAEKGGKYAEIVTDRLARLFIEIATEEIYG